MTGWARRAAAVGLLATVLATTASASSAEPERQEPQGPGKVAFPADFPALVDHEWGFPLGGFGGIERGAPITHIPVIFVHGNTVDAADWYPVRDAFRTAGWSDQELWALSYNGLGGNSGTALLTGNPERDAEHEEMGWDGQVRVTNNEVNVPDLHDFILAVRDYTGSDRFAIVGHSLGVTLARRTLKVHAGLRDDLVAFVGIAGGNHGTSLCPPGSEGHVTSCDEVAAGSPWLAELNGPDGSDETYGQARWLTIFDGSGAADPAFLGPTYAASPQLAGADNQQFPGTYHNDLRVSPAMVAVYRAFIEDAHAAAAGPAPAPGPPAAPTPSPVPPTPVSSGVFSSPGGFTSSAPTPVAVAEGGADADADGSVDPGDGRQAAAPITSRTISTIGRHWSGAANVVAAMVLLAGVGLIALDDHRRKHAEART